MLCLQTLTGERALIASLWPPRPLHRCASLSPSYDEGAAVCRTGVFPVKIRQAKPLYLTFACPRLPTYRPSSLFPSSVHVRGPFFQTTLDTYFGKGLYSSCFLVQTLQFTGARILNTPPFYFCLHRECEGVWSYSYSLFRSEDSWAWVANPAGVFGYRPAFTRAQWRCSR